MTLRAVIFDLDGVIVTTDEFHYQAWQRLADEEGIPFDRAINQRLRGVSRMESLEIILEKSAKAYTSPQKDEMAARKNGYYRALLKNLSPKDILPGVMDFLYFLKTKGIKTAIGSSSRNGRDIMTAIGLMASFDAVVDGNDITASKPDPQVFVKAALALDVPPAECLVVEDADAGVEAGLNGGMKVLAVGYASANPKAHWHAADLRGAGIREIFK